MRAIWPGALLVVYLSATAIVLVAGRSRVSAMGIVMHLAVLAAIAAATWVPRLPRWLMAWAPLMALFFLYTEMPMLIRAVGHDAVYDALVIAWENALFGGQPSLAWAARWPSRVLSELLHLAYFCYYAIIVSVPALLYWLSRRADFSEAVFVLMLTFIVCFLFYLIFPVAGPRYLATASTDAPHGPVRSVVVWLLETRSSRGTAFPSSHVAVALTQSILAVRYFGARGFTVGVVSVGLALGAIYGGFHYAVDVIAGALLGMLTCALGLVLWPSRARASQANATAPT
jgi:membrane-associated phospholipid phosphatase